MKKIGLLGSTGSIGTQTLQVVDEHTELFKIIYLTANNNVNLLCAQANKYKPKMICIVNESKYDYCVNNVPSNIQVFKGRDGLLEISNFDKIDLMINGLVGSSGMGPTINGLQSGIDIALCNKESMVMAGEFINVLKNNNNVNIFPMDSEHSAIWQCMKGEDYNQISKLILTGSGGPFREKSINDFINITKQEALNHPNWIMGNKITIDSATMMNKGLEVIEAYWLFNIPIEKIEIIIHPESILHSMVEFIDGSIKGQLGLPDMKIPIQYALSYPNHIISDGDKLDLKKIRSLTFEEPDLNKFPCIQLAFDAIKIGGTLPAVLNVANDKVVEAYLNDKIKFVEIPEIISLMMEKHNVIFNPKLEDIELTIDETKSNVKQYLRNKN